MSAASAPRPAADLVTCPGCKLTFPASASADATAGSPGPHTVTMLPEESPPEPVTPADALPGSQPSRLGRFQITRYLGEGVFGRVYEAHDPLLKRTVALKVAKPEQLAGQKRVERFQREARAAANLQHPHIVAVFDSGSEGGFHYIASAFVPGRSLAAILEELPRSKRLELREAVQIVRKLAEALGYAHKQGVVHRDVKPGNVMLRDDGEPMLMDFGLAAMRDETEKLTVAGQFMGTPEYTAPEQWRGQAEAASDQYSLGCLLFEVLTGERPFAGASSEHLSPQRRCCRP
jgi:serine/threonine protein kinase